MYTEQEENKALDDLAESMRLCGTMSGCVEFVNTEERKES